MNNKKEYMVVLNGAEHAPFIRAECHAYIDAYNTMGKFNESHLQGFYLGLYFKTLERALDEGKALHVRVSDLISGKYGKYSVEETT